MLNRTGLLIPAEELTHTAVRILVAAGASQANAAIVAEAMVDADLSGVETHGVYGLKRYIEAILRGGLVPTATPEVIKEGRNSALVRGNWTFGQVAADFAVRVGAIKARENDIALVSLVQCHHTGRLGRWAELAASLGAASFIFTGGFSVEAPAAFPYGGREKVLHTNPITIGFPLGPGRCFCADFSTSGVAGIKVERARARNEKLPYGSIADKHGRPTDDPAEFYDGGGHLPFGEHKGYALMLAAEYMGRIISGSDAHAVKDMADAALRNQGVTFIVFRPEVFVGMETYMERADELANRIGRSRPAEGFAEVLMPGEIERRRREEGLRKGVTVSRDTWRAVTEVAASLGVSIPCGNG